MSTKQHYLVRDLALCFNCNNCHMACKDEHVGNDWLPYTESMQRHNEPWMTLTQKVRGQAPRIDACYLGVSCMHCEECALVKAYPDLVTRREDGIVMIDPIRAKGHKELVAACPYHTVTWNEELGVAQKCTMCVHILDSGEAPGMPRCCHSCPTESVKHYYLTPEEMEEMVRKEGLEVLKPELGTKPHVFYKNLYRYTTNFITGCVIRNEDCVENITVTLTGEGVEDSMQTDYFGEFKFDRLRPGTYTIAVDGAEARTVTIEESLNVGALVI